MRRGKEKEGGGGGDWTGGVTLGFNLGRPEWKP